MFNEVMLIGHLGQDPTVRALDAGVKVASFSLATSKSFKDKDGEKQTKTQWHNIVAWRGLAEVAERFLKKGHLVLAKGEITYRTYENAEGEKRYVTEIICSEMRMLGGRKEGEDQASAVGTSVDPGPSQRQVLEPSDELPF